MRSKPLRTVRSAAHETRRQARERFDAVAESRRNQKRLSAAITALGTVLLAVEPAAAQLGENTGALCGTGADTAYVFIMSMIVLAGVVFGSIQTAFGLINLNSTDDDTHRKGQTGLKSGATSFGVILVPIFVTVFIEVMGVNLASCFIPDINVLGGAMMAFAIPAGERFGRTEETA